MIFYFVYSALESKKNVPYLAFIITSVLGIYTYTFTIFVLFIINLYFILDWSHNRSHLRKWLLSHVIIFVACIPELFHIVYHIVAGTTKLYDFPIGLRAVVGTFYVFTSGRVFFPTKTNLLFIFIQVIIFGMGFLLGIWSLWQANQMQRERRQTFLFSAAALSYIFIYFFSVIFIPLFDEARVNYIIFFLPFYYLLIAKGWNYIPNIALKRIFVSLIIIVSLVPLFPYYFEWDKVGKGQFQVASKYVQQSFKENDVIYHTSGQSYLPFAYYFDWKVPQIPIQESDPNLVSGGRLWLIVRQERGGLEFALTLFDRERTNSREQDVVQLCNSYVTERKFELDKFEVFPGKNGLVICLYDWKENQ